MESIHDRLIDGERYKFLDLNGTKRVGTYERESSSFLVGEKERFTDHKLFFEVAASSLIHLDTKMKNQAESKCIYRKGETGCTNPENLMQECAEGCPFNRGEQS